jgi:acyl carrier protein
MPEFDDRLQRCFASVFPGLTEEEIRTGSAGEGTWDSLSLVTLVAVIQEEFDIEIPQEKLGTLDSFDAFCACVGRLQQADQ